MKRFKTIAAVAACILFAVATAYAATEGHGEAAGGHGEAAGGHGPNYTDFILRLVNFAIFLGLIWFLAGKKIKAFFTGRETQIKNELDDLEARRRNAEAKLRQVEKSISNIEQERQAVLDEFVAQGEALKKSIVEEAARKAERMQTQAEIAIATERNTALGELRSEMAELIVEAAEKILREKLTKEEHEKLVEDYLTKVVLN